MKKLKKHELDFDLTYKYFFDHLKISNSLSKKILELIDFNEGDFYTLLPLGEVNVEYLYRFKSGLVLPPGPIEEIVVLGHKYQGEITPTVDSEVANFILEKTNKNKKLSCIFEDVQTSPTDTHVDLFKSIGVLFEDKIYYIIKPSIATYELILEAFKETDVIWHFLCILTEAETNSFSQGNNLSTNNIELFIKKLKMIIVGAYDGSGYLFWEPK